MRTILFGLLACMTLTAQTPEQFGVTVLTPPSLILKPDQRYWPRMRMWQGIPSIERTANGRLWATWYCGPVGEGSHGFNHAVLVTSNDDGKTWSNPVAVCDPTQFFSGSAADPCLWVDPQGRLWWFISRQMKLNDEHEGRSAWGFCADNPEDETLNWSPPVFAGYGVALNKPTVLSNGDWLRPVSVHNAKPERRAHFYVSRDQGRSFQFLSALKSDPHYREHMAFERKDGSVLMFARTNDGIAQAESTDRGATWSEAKPLNPERGVSARFYIRRLKSGNLLFVLNDHAKARTNLTAMLSEDDGKTWPHKLLLDDRALVSYPDVAETKGGFLYIIYDHGRYTKGEQEILFTKITEADIKAGKLLNSESRQRQLINRLADHGGGVRITNEPQQMKRDLEQKNKK